MSELPLAWDTSDAPSAFDPDDWLAHRERLSGRARPTLPPLAVQTVDDDVWNVALARAIAEPDDFTAAGHPFVSLANGVTVGRSAKGSTAAGGLDELFALGVKACISVGGGGAITSDLPIGALVVPRDALADDGVACQYVGPTRTVAADPELTECLCAAVATRGATAHGSRVWTTTAHYRQTIPRLRAFRGEGCIAVDNESAAAFAVGQHRSRAVARLLVIGDTIADDRFHAPEGAEMAPAEAVLDIALNALARWWDTVGRSA